VPNLEVLATTVEVRRSQI